MSKKIVRTNKIKIVQPKAFKTHHNISNLFKLEIKQDESETSIKMRVCCGVLYTRDLPNTITFLKNSLPSVFKSECFNKDKIPFLQEVQNTELGHLFEHILIEYLCILKYARSGCGCVYSGVTTWDWCKEKRGIFHIKIDTGYKDAEIFQLALVKTVSLMLKILLPLPKFSHLPLSVNN